MSELTLEKICCNCMSPLKGGINICPVCGFDRASYQSPSEALPPETILRGRYLIGKCLGVGGFGITYLALDLKGRDRLAIKEYFPSGLVVREEAAHGSCRVEPLGGRERKIFQEGVQDYLKEGEHLALFRNLSNIVTVKEYFTENNTAYLVMDYVEGRTVSQYLKAIGPVDPRQAAAYLAPIIESLITIHGQGLIHRDISPANIIITPDGQAVLIDFGAARNYLEDRMDKEIIVKRGYAPVEQYSDQSGKQGPWTDVYALCATMYRMITGKVPVESVARKNGERLPLPAEYGVAIRPELEQILMKGLEVSVEDRYQSLRELYSDLYRYMKQMAQEDFNKSPVTDSGASMQNASKTDEKRKGKAASDKPPEELKRRTPGAKTFLIGAAAMVTVVLAAGMLVLGITNQNQHLDNAIQDVNDALRIPNLDGMQTAAAMTELEKSGLKMEVVEVNYSDTIPNGVVTGQEPEKGEKAAYGDVVKVKRSGGREEVMMVGLSGKSREEAESWLRKQNLLEQVSWQEDPYEDGLYSDVFPEGTILSQSVEAGDIYMVGEQPLKLEVCQGSLAEKTDEMPVPDLVGKTVSKAVKKVLPKKAGEKGYTFALEDEDGWTYEFSRDYKPGTIVSQEPKAGETARTNKKIHIAVARDLKNTKVPDMADMNLTEAEKALYDAHLAVNKREAQSDSVPEGKVIGLSYIDEKNKEQPVEAGMELQENTQIIVTVSIGNKEKLSEASDPGNSKGDKDNGAKQPEQTAPENTQNAQSDPAPQAGQPAQTEPTPPANQPAPEDGGDYDPSFDAGGAGSDYDPSFSAGGL